jgi:hypothetical protein
MLFLIQFLSLLQSITADMEPEYYPLTISENNILAASLWAMGVCSCVGLVCKHKKNIPITVRPVNKWEMEYRIEQKEGGDLKEFKNQLNELKYAVDYLINEEKEKEYQKKFIDPDIQFMFGNGPIQIKKDDKYYHGTTEENMKNWLKGDGALHRFFERVDEKEMKWDFGTKDHNQYCKNCSYDEENSKRRTVFNVYKCNGHEIL